MEAALDLSSGKTHRDENFPVASLLIAREHREPVMAFYRFARAADDIADSPDARPDEKLARLAQMRRGLSGAGAPEAESLSDVMATRGLNPVHAHELLDAFEQDVTVRRYPDWQSLLGYCRLSAAPVGRFVLDVHGESPAIWPLSDALCTALQLINHLQDCAGDYRRLDRVYLPLDLLRQSGSTDHDLAAKVATPALRRAISTAAERTGALLAQSASFAGSIRSRRLAAEVAVIQHLATSLNRRLLRRDPLSERVHHGKPEAFLLALMGLGAHFLGSRRS